MPCQAHAAQLQVAGAAFLLRVSSMLPSSGALTAQQALAHLQPAVWLRELCALRALFPRPAG